MPSAFFTVSIQKIAVVDKTLALNPGGHSSRQEILCLRCRRQPSHEPAPALPAAASGWGPTQ